MKTVLLHNAVVRTMDAYNPSADAVLVHGDRVLAVGTKEQIHSLMRIDEQCDLAGLALFPGFVDAHLHLGAYSERLSRVDLDGLSSVDAALGRVEEFARTLSPGEWLLGGGYNYNLWGVRPHRRLLDRVAPDHPVILDSKDFHSAWLNSAAMRAIGVDRHTPDPPGGAIERDDDGEPSGVLKENAVRLSDGKLPRRSVEQKAETIRKGIAALHGYGLVGAHSPGALEGPASVDELIALQLLESQGRLPFRVSVMIPRSQLESAISLGIQDGFGSPTLQVRGVKMFADGALGSQTALMLEPYLGSADSRGMALLDRETLTGQIINACEHGISVAVHAIGDAANRLVIDALEACRPHVERWGLRNRIEHLQLLSPDDLPRLARTGAVASMQPLHCASDIDIVRRYWGEERGLAYAWRSVLDAGLTLAFGSDAPVEVPDAIAGIYAATTRRRADGYPEGGWQPHERLSVAEAVRAYTLGAALACGREKECGSIAPGKLADFTLLDRDIVAEGPESVRDAQVAGTMVGGEWVYGGPSGR